MARTYYDVLMVSPAADVRIITVVYRHLAKRYHPDVDPSPEAAARMAEINEAYAVLSDRARRDHYDELLSLGSAPAPSPPRAPAPAPDMRPRPAPEPGPVYTTPSTSTAGPDAGQPLAGPASSPYGEAGPPPANPSPSGSTLTFGRYRGWTLNQVARVDRDYLEWLSRTTMGRNYRRELDELLGPLRR
jgi:curved DNA-binding protein CbpA